MHTEPFTVTFPSKISCSLLLLDATKTKGKPLTLKNSEIGEIGSILNLKNAILQSMAQITYIHREEELI